MTTLANAVQTLQSDIVNILKTDSTSLTFNTDGETNTLTSTLASLRIVDGVPTKQIREGGFPLIIVHTPEITGERLTFTKHKSEMEVHIQIIDRREGNIRILTDAVIESLKNNENTTKGDGYWWYGRRMRTNLNYVFLSNEEGKAVWHMNIFLTYLWTGS